MNRIKMIQLIYEYRILLIIIISIALIILYRFLKPKIKGYLGELKVRLRLFFLNKKEYKIIHNLRIFHNGMMSQIDHVVISKYGVFVIETKNYSGWIFGGENSLEWTQVIYKNKFKLYNPLRQNFGHVKAIKGNLTSYPYLDYFPIVVFSGSAKLKVNSSFPVIKLSKLLKTIKGTNDINITEETRDEIYDLLLRLNGNKPNINLKKLEDQTFTNSSNLCPYCSNPLVLKHGKYGDFFGCTDFPRCRYTKRISK